MKKKFEIFKKRKEKQINKKYFSSINFFKIPTLNNKFLNININNNNNNNNNNNKELNNNKEVNNNNIKKNKNYILNENKRKLFEKIIIEIKEYILLYNSNSIYYKNFNNFYEIFLIGINIINKNLLNFKYDNNNNNNNNKNIKNNNNENNKEIIKNEVKGEEEDKEGKKEEEKEKEEEYYFNEEEKYKILIIKKDINFFNNLENCNKLKEKLIILFKRFIKKGKLYLKL
jgi:hypothetical protein